MAVVNITHPEGILAAQVGYSSDSNANGPMWAFSQTSTQLCATGTSSTTNNVITCVKACSVPYPSTVGKWVHGAMVFDARASNFTFFLNGAQLASDPSYVQPAYDATAFMPYQDSSAGSAITLLSAQDSNGNTISISAGTAVDNIRVLSLQPEDDFIADIAATYNQPFNSSAQSAITVVYAEFHAGYDQTGTDILYLTNGGSASSVSLFTARKKLNWLTPTTTIRSCGRAGCGPHDTVSKDVVYTPASSSGGGSSSGAGASTGGASTTGGDFLDRRCQYGDRSPHRHSLSRSS